VLGSRLQGDERREGLLGRPGAPPPQLGWRGKVAAREAARRLGAIGLTSLRGACVVLGLAILTVFTLLTVLAGALHGFRERDRIRGEVLPEARSLAAFVDAQLRARLDGLGVVADAVTSSRGNAAAVDPQIRLLQRSFADLTTVAVLDERGAVVTSTAPAREGSRAAWPRAGAAAAGPVVGAPRRTSAGITARLSVPARGRDGHLQGFVVAEVALGGDRGLLGRLGPGAGAAAEILTPGGSVAVSDPSRLRTLPTVGGARLGDLVRGEWVGELTAEDGVRRYVGAAPIRAAGWTVVAARRVGGIRADALLLLTKALGGAVVALAVGIGLGLLLIRRPAAELGRIGAGLHRLAADDIPSNVLVTGNGEVGALGDAFNRTLERLRQRLGHYRALSQVEDAASAAISGDRSLAQIITDVLRNVVTGMAGDMGIAFLREEDNLVARGAVGLWGVPTDGLVVRRDGTFTGSVLAGRTVQVVRDTETDGRTDEPHVTAAGLRSIIAAPMISRDKAIGVVEVGYRTARSFSDAEVERLQVMTRRLVQAVEQARALEHAPDLPARVLILKRRAALDGVTLPEEVALLIAQEVPSSIRELESAFVRILAFADLTESELTPDLVQEFFERTRRPEGEAGAAPASPARPAPFLAIVRRGATELFETLKRSIEQPSVVEVIWDRRVGSRRRRDQQRTRERRQGDRRRASSVAQEGQHYLLVRRAAR